MVGEATIGQPGATSTDFVGRAGLIDGRRTGEPAEWEASVIGLAFWWRATTGYDAAPPGGTRTMTARIGDDVRRPRPGRAATAGGRPREILARSPACQFPVLMFAMVALLRGANGAEPLPAKPAAAPITPGDLDTDASRVWVFVGSTGFGHDHAIVGRLVSGHVTLDASEAAGRLVFDMPSFVADSPEAREALGISGERSASTRQQTTDTMLGPAVLDVARHPTATFDIDSALRSPRPVKGVKPTVDLVGSFTLRGVTRKVVIPAEVESAGRVLHVSGSFRIKQTDFGIKPLKKFGGFVGVADDVEIRGDLRIAATPVAGRPADLTAPTAKPPAGRLPVERPVPATVDGAR